MIELRAIIIEHKDTGDEVRLLTRGMKGDNYEHLNFPSGVPLNKGQVLKFLKDYYNITPDDIHWAVHVKDPEDE